MVFQGSPDQPVSQPVKAERFRLDSFEWAAPDRLRVSGRFIGLRNVPAGMPVLVLQTQDGERRLPAVGGEPAGKLASGAPWSGEFAWQEVPVPFETAALALDDVVVDLPPVGAKKSLFRSTGLEIRRPTAPGEAEAVAQPADAEEPAGTGLPEYPPGAGAQVALPAESVEARQAATAAERAEEELERTRTELDAERAARATDAERFRAALSDLRDSADRAVAGARDEATALGAELEDARSRLVGADRAISDLRARVQAAESQLTEAEEAHRCEVDALRQRLAVIDDVAESSARAREEAAGLVERLRSIVDVLNRSA